MQTILNIDEIISDPNIRGGRPILRGTTLRVADIVTWRLSGDFASVEAIAEEFSLNIGQVHAALAYYYLHQDEIDSQMREDDERGERLAEQLIAQGRAQ